MGDEWTRVIKEKDEQIAQLMEEGEKLSKQELQSNSIIKKLRQKDKQNDQLLAAQRYTYVTFLCSIIYIHIVYLLAILLHIEVFIMNTD